MRLSCDAVKRLEILCCQKLAEFFNFCRLQDCLAITAGLAAGGTGPPPTVMTQHVGMAEMCQALLRSLAVDKYAFNPPAIETAFT